VKKKTEYLVKELSSHFRKMENIKRRADNLNHYFSKRARVRKSLTQPNQQFKKERIDKKVIKVISKYGDQLDTNIYERRTGRILILLMEGKIRYHKMLKRRNMVQARGEIAARGLSEQFDIKRIGKD